MKLLILFVAALALVPLGQPPSAANAPLAETLMGAWSGHWATETPQARGSAELLLARVPGRDEVVGQFTFVIGSTARALRYEGRITNGALHFPLVGEGRITLASHGAARPGAARRLRGGWKDDRGALPAPQGVLELSRVK